MVVLKKRKNTVKKRTWQQQMSDSLIQSDDLFAKLEIDPNLLPPIFAIDRNFPLRVPESFIDRMKKGDPLDPLLLQVLPQSKENEILPGFSLDPLNESEANPIPGLLHKYNGRVLLTVTGACAIHCRYCFRRHYPYADQHLTSARWQSICDYILKDPTINEIIFSGGDPLSLSNEKWRQCLLDLNQMTQIKRVRIHTRLPIVLPGRMEKEFLDVLNLYQGPIVIVFHVNHPNEINLEVEHMIAEVRERGIHCLNQSVLLKGINDDPQVLKNLSERLFAAGVLPYYLHLLDKVQGAAHFYVDDKMALGIFYDLRAVLPGFLLPRLVREIPGANSKEMIGA